MVRLEPTGHEILNMSSKIFYEYLGTKQQSKTYEHFIKNLCDEVGLHLEAMLLMSQGDVETYGSQTVGNK